MNTTITKTVLAVSGSLLMTAFISILVSIPAVAQEVSDEERRARVEERRQEIQQRRAEFLENNPEAAARMAERRQRFEELQETNTEAAARIREQRREKFREGRPGPGPGNRGNRAPGERGRLGPPPGTEESSEG